jgi:tRNA pseudouridine38-40 synthase
MKTYKVTISYDGTSYFGWQKTKTGPSIQETLEKAIKRITQEEVLPEAASRTDRGVHATGQVISFSLTKEWEARSLERALNAVLPSDIRIARVEEAPSGFHPTLDAKEKEYRYSFCLAPVQDPIHRLYSWAFRYPLDLAKMERAAKDLLGCHDFSGFANITKENPICAIYCTRPETWNFDRAKTARIDDRKRVHISNIDPFTIVDSSEFSRRSKSKFQAECSISGIAISPLPEDRLEIAITGNRFLYKMARNLVGSLAYIGCGKLPEDAVSKILASKDRKTAGVTAPSHGLFLYRVDYHE